MIVLFEESADLLDTLLLDVNLRISSEVEMDVFNLHISQRI